MRKYLILFLIISAISAEEIATIIMNELYGNYNSETKSSVFSIDDVLENCIETKDERGGRDFTEYTHEIYGVIFSKPVSLLEAEKRMKEYYKDDEWEFLFKPKYEGSISFIDSKNNINYISIISLDRDYNQGFSTYQVTYTIKNNSVLIINPLEEIRGYPNRFKSSLNELVEIEFGKENQKKNIGFKVISQYGRSGENIGLLAVFNNKLQIVLDNVSYSYDGNRNCDYEDRNGEIFIDNKPFVEWKNNSAKWKDQELTEEDVRFMWVKCSGKSISEVNIVESGKRFNDIKIGKNIYSFLNDNYQIIE